MIEELLTPHATDKNTSNWNFQKSIVFSGKTTQLDTINFYNSLTDQRKQNLQIQATINLNNLVFYHLKVELKYFADKNSILSGQKNE